MAERWSDEQIAAFCDGEADGETALAILIDERRDPALAERIRQVRENDAFLKTAMDLELAEPAPPLPSVPDAAPRRERFAASPFAMAASLACAAFVGALATQWIDRGANAERAAQEAALAVELNQILETRLSGEDVDVETPAGVAARVTPRTTYRSESGHWCRDFDETISRQGDAEEVRRGVACRIEGEWRRIRTVIDGEISGQV